MNHSTVHVMLVCITVLRREKVRKSPVKVWSEDASLALQGCFDCIDGSVFTDRSDNIDELTEVICSSISFCRDTVFPKRL